MLGYRERKDEEKDAGVLPSRMVKVWRGGRMWEMFEDGLGRCRFTEGWSGVGCFGEFRDECHAKAAEGFLAIYLQELRGSAGAKKTE